MQSLGEILRREREKRGLTIDALAEQTRINPAYFRAIEEGDRASLPGGFFYRSFLRQYARLLELPEDVYESEIARSLEQEARDPIALPDRHIDVPPMPTGATDRAVETRRWVVRLAALVAVVALATMLYTVYLRWRTPIDIAQTGEPEPPPIALPTEPEPPPATPSSAATSEAASDAPPSTETAAAADPAPPPASGPVQLRLAAREPVWVEVWADGRRVFSNLMNTADARSFGAQGRIRVLLGNAGGMDLEWNGRALEPVGPRGQVRTVEFSPEGYQLITPAPRTPAPESDSSPPASA